MNTKVKGYMLGAIAAAAYGMNPLFALPLYAEGMSVDSVLFFRYLFAIPLLGIMLKGRGHDFRLKRREIYSLAGMGVLFALSSLTLFMSYHYMDAGIASTLLFVYPIMVAIIMACVFGERITLQTALCIAMALGGIALLYKGSDGATLSLAGTLLVFTSSLSYAIYIVYVNHSCLKEMATLKVTFYVLLFGWAVFAIRLFLTGEIQTPHSWFLWGNVLALALFPTAVSLLCTTSAIHLIGSTPAAILGALEPVTAVFFGITVFGETVGLREGAGFLLIITAVSLVVAGNRIGNYIIRLRKMFPRLIHRSSDSGTPSHPA